MITIDQVPAWYIESGIGHIVMSNGGPGSKGAFSACQTWWPSGFEQSEITSETPKRICRKCRAALSNLKPAGQKEVTDA